MLKGIHREGPLSCLECVIERFLTFLFIFFLKFGNDVELEVSRTEARKEIASFQAEFFCRPTCLNCRIR